MKQSRLFAVAGLVALVALVGTFVLVQQLTTTSAATTEAQMALNVSAGATCDDATEPTKCDVPLNGAFTLDVNVLAIPSAGHIGMQTFVDYGSLIYKPAAAANDEVVISTCGYPGIAVRAPGTPIGDEGTVAHGMTAGFPPVFTTCFDGGTIVSLSMNCTAMNSAHDVDLVPIPEDLIGAGFKVDAVTTVPAKISVRPMVINCGTAPPATDTPVGPTNTSGPTETEGPATATQGPATETPTEAPPTATSMVPLGSVDCNTVVNSVDAALVLQREVAIINSLPCDVGDVNDDGATNAVDAALMLQCDAGIIPCVFPV